MNTHFSTRRSVAAALLYGPLDGSFYEDEALFRSRREAIERFAQRVTLRHRWSMTVDVLRAVDAGLEGGGKPGILGMAQTRASLDRFRDAFGSRPLVSWRDAPELLRLPRADALFLGRRFWRGYRSRLPFLGGTAARAAWRSVERDFRDIEFPLAGRVSVRLQDGSSTAAECRIPPGFAGDPGRAAAIAAKFDREAIPIVGAARSRELSTAVLNLPQGSARGIMEAAFPSRRS